MESKTFLVTGAAGFIGFHLAQVCLERGHRVVGFDNVNDYYDVRLKEARLRILGGHDAFTFVRADLADQAAVERVFAEHRPAIAVNLAAQAGVRYSLENPRAYMDSNIIGFLHVLEACRRHGVEHLVYASSSSVYGANTRLPFSVHDNVDHPLSLYAASKKSNELMAHAYSQLFDIACTGLRFFTVYGPWGRPDMALFKFTKNILAGEPIDVYGEGKQRRDFTYIDDIVEGVYRVALRTPTRNPDWSGDRPDPASSTARYYLYNIGNHRPVELMDYIRLIEENLGKKAIMNLMPMQPGDVPSTQADVDDLTRDTGFAPDTPVEVGIARFIDWYREFYKV